MLKEILEYVPSLTTFAGVLLYWVPMVVCVIGYSFKLNDVLKEEFAKRDKALAGEGYYTPSLTVGKLLFYGFLCIIPVVNLWLAVVEFLPKYIGRFFKIFDIPLVSWTEEDEKNRKAAINIKEELNRRK